MKRVLNILYFSIMSGSRFSNKVSVTKDPKTVIGTGGFAATLKILETSERAQASPGVHKGPAINSLPNFGHADITRHPIVTLSSENGSVTGSREPPRDQAKLNSNSR